MTPPRKTAAPKTPRISAAARSKDHQPKPTEPKAVDALDILARVEQMPGGAMMVRAAVAEARLAAELAPPS